MADPYMTAREKLIADYRAATQGQSLAPMPFNRTAPNPFQRMSPPQIPPHLLAGLAGPVAPPVAPNPFGPGPRPTFADTGVSPGGNGQDGFGGGNGGLGGGNGQDVGVPGGQGFGTTPEFDIGFSGEGALKGGLGGLLGGPLGGLIGALGGGVTINGREVPNEATMNFGIGQQGQVEKAFAAALAQMERDRLLDPYGHMGGNTIGGAGGGYGGFDGSFGLGGQIGGIPGYGGIDVGKPGPSTRDAPRADF